MYNIIVVRYGEIAVKGRNRYMFEDKLVTNIKNSLKDVGNVKVYKGDGRLYIDVDDFNYMDIVEEAKKVFGVFSLSPAIKGKRDFEILKENAKRVLEDKIDMDDIKTFKVESKRPDKSFKLKSPEMSREIGGFLLSNFSDDVSVNVRKPDATIFAEMRKDCSIVYADKIDGFGGLPLGTNGKALLLLSGGIDSPVAGFLIGKRGVEIEAIHFHSYPFTNEKSQEKVRDLARILAKYCGKITMHKANILPVQKQINKNCEESHMTIISRRFMMRIANQLAKKIGANALITGESIGQVASQTMQGLNATNAVIDMPAFRPLIGTDKSEIIDIAKAIKTYETSIIPEEDCCTVFLPKKPVTKPRLEKIERLEESLDIDSLVNEVLENIETIEVTY
ncbi:MAG: tRNA 4-thiouridine(8) synthase ThiI [Peptostreptococcaceae bacterium]|nr:tRNA 4-thiouridine(8) synthase ThiI [Peptostreptococcaceae bacterium]